MKLRPSGRVVQAHGAQARGLLGADGPDVQRAATQLLSQLGQTLIVDIQRHVLQAGEVQQPALGLPVGVHAAVVVEVVLREVGEHRGVHARAGQPAFNDADAGGLDRAGRKAGVAHAGKRRLAGASGRAW